MNKLIIAATAVSFFLASCNNSKNPTQSAENESAAVRDSGTLAPLDITAIKFEKTSFDFGKVTEGKKVTYDYKFTNTGEAPLIITSAEATCGCTVPEYPHKPILPGESSTIKVVFNSEGRVGMQNKVITITANTSPAATEVYLLGEVTSK